MLNNTVNLLPVLRTAAILVLVFLAGTGTSRAQALPGPERETLLNGLRILYWPQPANPKVVLKLRIHSGAAFDLADKAGMMALLGDALFPDPATREYVTEELEGRLEVTTSLDSLDVTISGKASVWGDAIASCNGSVRSARGGWMPRPTRACLSP